MNLRHAGRCHTTCQHVLQWLLLLCHTDRYTQFDVTTGEPTHDKDGQLLEGKVGGVSPSIRHLHAKRNAFKTQPVNPKIFADIYSSHPATTWCVAMLSHPYHHASHRRYQQCYCCVHEFHSLEIFVVQQTAIYRPSAVRWAL